MKILNKAGSIISEKLKVLYFYALDIMLTNIELFHLLLLLRVDVGCPVFDC